MLSCVSSFPQARKYVRTRTLEKIVPSLIDLWTWLAVDQVMKPLFIMPTGLGDDVFFLIRVWICLCKLVVFPVTSYLGYLQLEAGSTTW